MIWYVATLLAGVISTGGSAAQGAHSVREEPQFVTARAGDSVILGCDVVHPVTGQQPPYVVEWFKFGVPIPIFIKFGFYPPHVDPEYAGRASLYDKASLRIDQLHSEDQGWYECKVLMLDQQYDTFHNGSWVYVTVNAPPTFTETPSPYVEAKEGSSITLTCTAFGNPKPVVSWLRDKVLLENSRKYTVSDGSLTISSVGRNDRGPYTCRAYSIQGEAVHTTRLLVQGPPFIISPPENITVNISQDALFTCQAEAYPGNLTYTWFWEEENVFFKNDLKLRVRILIDGTLIIFRVKPEDAGKYTCVPSNSLGRSPSASSYLTVQYPARVVNMPPIIYLPVGMPGYIKCPVDADPPATQVKWTKDGRPLRIEKFQGWNLLSDGTITLEEATEEALGTYACVPYNTLGTMGQSTPARLVLKDPPYFTVLPGWEYRQEVGRELVIPCAAAGDPFPIISWRKVGKPSKSKHNILPSGSLQFKALSKEDHGQWECVATNVVTNITASTHLTVIGTSPHAPTNVRVTATMTSANASWDPGYDGGYEQTFTVWYGPVVKRAMLGPHDWLSLPVSTGLTWLLVEGLEPETAYQFSVLAQNKLGTGPFSEVITVNTLAFPVTTREPPVLLSPPRCLTANRTHQGVLLSWLSPANHSYPIDHYIMEFRLGERWEILDEAIPGTETELLTKELSLDSWYEFRVMAVMQDLISEPSNVVGVSSSDIFPPPEVPEEGLARPVVAGIVATICFLAAAILFSTLAACFVNRQRKRKNKRKRDPPLSITHCRKSVESPSSSGKVSPESIRTLRAPSDSSEDAQAIHAKMMSPGREREMSLYKKTKRAITSRKYSVSKHEAEADVSTPIELISRGPDGRFIMDPTEMETSLKTRRIEGFPFAEETDTYPEFRQSDEENNETLTPTAIMGLKSQLSPLSSSQESYLQPPAYSPSFQKTDESMGGLDARLQATGQIRRPAKGYPPSQFYGYLSSSSADQDSQPFYMPDISPLSSVMSSPLLLTEGPFGHPTLPADQGDTEIQHLVASSSTLPLTHTPTTMRSPEPWRRKELSISSIESSPVIFSHQQDTPESTLPKAGLPRGGPPSSLQVPAPYHSVLQLEAPKSRTGKPPSKTSGSVSLSQKHPHQPMQQSHGQLKHTSHGISAPTLPYTESAKQAGPSGTSTFSLDTRWYEPRPRPRPSPRQGRRTEASLHQVVLQPSRLSPLTQSPMSSHHASPEISSRPRPRPSLQPSRGIFPAGISMEMSEITLQPPAVVSLSRRSSPSSSPAQSSTAGQGSRRGSPSYRPHMALTPSTGSYTGSPSPAAERSEFYSQIPSQRRRGEEIPPFEHPPSHLSTSGRPPDTHGAAAVPESFEVLRYPRVRKPKKALQLTSKARQKNSFPISQVQQPGESQVLQPQGILYLQKKKRHSRQDPYAYFSAMKEEFHKYRHQPEDEMAILNHVDHEEHQGQATQL
ncbi:protein turtle homolog B isoform X1 [Chiloscyllium plagiosum]|uniref:protein turtle homolog B isoform X1 n=1 Tax=Chiloscyllium plagiosum TaxID=36176 RepID=UPI001CB85E36|nr:protein turtle homolog B isoform X1 [Chiloscyllium plagiosum]